MTKYLRNDALKAIKIRDGREVADVTSGVVGAPAVDLSITEASMLKFEVLDDGFDLLKSRVFDKGDLIRFGGESFEVVTVAIEFIDRRKARIQINAYSRGIQLLKKSTKPVTRKNLSPTQLARFLAKKVGLGFIGQSTPRRKQIVQERGSNAWEKITSLASDHDFECYEANGRLTFGSRRWIAAGAPRIPYDFLNDDKTIGNPQFSENSDGSISLTLYFDYVYAERVQPGNVVRVSGAGVRTRYNGNYVITAVKIAVDGVTPVQIDAEKT